MKKINKKLLTLTVFALVFSLATSLVFAKSDKGKEKSENKNKSEKVKEIKDFEKPTKEKDNAEIHKEKTEKVSNKLKNIGEDNKIREKNEVMSGQEDSSEISEEVEDIAEEAEEIAEEISETSDDAAEAIDAVEKENKFKKFLVGTDYKNLGQLRSSLAHNENQIRKLTKLSERLQTQEMEQNMGVESEIENQLVILMQERERIKTVLEDGQESFSILGWFGKLFGTKTEVDVDEENEEDLEEEVLEVLEDDSPESEDPEENSTEEEEVPATE